MNGKNALQGIFFFSWSNPQCNWRIMELSLPITVLSVQCGAASRQREERQEAALKPPRYSPQLCAR